MNPIKVNLDKLSRIQSLHGWCTLEKAQAMAELVYETKPSLLVEIGVFGGRSLIAQGLALQSLGGGCIWGIDPWTNDAAVVGEVGEANRDWWMNLDISSIRNDALRAVGEFGLWEYVRVIVAKAESCFDLFRGIDILHIDGNHSEECSCRDVNLWVPRVKQGGHVWFDDADWQTTKSALNAIERYCDKVMDVGNCRLFKVR